MWGLDLSNSSLYDFLKIDQINDARFLRDLFNVSDKDVIERCDILRIWASYQCQLPQEAQDVEFIEKMLYLNKFDVNRTKSKILGFFHLFELYPELFTNLGTVRYQSQSGIVIVSPIHTDKLERVFFALLNPSRLDGDVDYEKILIMITTLSIIILQGDYTYGIRIVFDFQHVTYQHFLKFHPGILWKLRKMYQSALSIRITGIELINVPNFVSSILGLARTCLSPKMFDLIKIHDNYQSLHGQISRKCLPLEYGGDSLGSFQKWFVIIDQIMENYEEGYSKLASFVPQPNNNEDDYFFGAFI